jgi:hypothetical protein
VVSICTTCFNLQEKNFAHLLYLLVRNLTWLKYKEMALVEHLVVSALDGDSAWRYAVDCFIPGEGTVENRQEGESRYTEMFVRTYETKRCQIPEDKYTLCSEPWNPKAWHKFLFLFLFSVAQQPNSGLSCYFAKVSRHTHTRSGSPKRVISSSQRPLPTQHKTNPSDENPWPQRDSNPRSQKSSGFRQNYRGLL